MLKEKNKLNCHCEEHSATRQSNEIASHSFAMTEQCGRSMVEMLGVLAVMGVLSVAGVGGYTAAMKRHRANELINEANKRAVVLAMKIAAGQEVPTEASDGLISEFDNPTGYEFKILKNPSNPQQFKMEIDGVSKEVCEQMKATMGGTVRGIDCPTGESGSGTLTFNNDMSTTDTAPAQITCEDSEKEEKTYYIGACCDVSIKGKFCPGEDVPTCTKMDEDACACPSTNGESCCNTAGGTWKSLPGPPGNGSCIPEGANSKCSSSGYGCAKCKQNETPVCNSNCTCGITEKSAACSSATSCISCPAKQKAVCSGYSCMCCESNQTLECSYGATGYSCVCKDL